MVWDLPLRLFHWFMVAVVTTAGLTGFLAPASWLDVHVYAGYGLGLALAFRLVWGFIGSHYSKFATFPLAIRDALGHLRLLLGGKSPAQPGHNPIGAWMIAVLITVLTALLLTGLVALGGQEKLGPLAFMTSYRTGHLAKEVHEFAAWALVGVVAIHLLGVFVENVVFRHPVLRAMLTGRKVAPDQAPQIQDHSHAGRGLIVLALTGGLLLTLGGMLGDKTPWGWRALDVPVAYAAECGDCHDAHHPSLRTALAWRAIMAGLSDHFGEDASLDPETGTIITAYLVANHAGTFDTKVARRMGRDDTPSLRITDTRRWKKRHRDIAARVFGQKNIGSKVNCNSCHQDGASGRFDDSKTHLPIGANK